MEITKNSLETARGPAEWFSGTVFTDTVAAAPPLSSAAVHFTPGARTAWHTHPRGQTIFVTEGIGLCQREGGSIEVIRPGAGSSSSRVRTTGTERRRIAS